MTTIALHHPPSLSAVFRAYCRSLLIAYRGVHWILAALVLLSIAGFAEVAATDHAVDVSDAVSVGAPPHGPAAMTERHTTIMRHPMPGVEFEVQTTRTVDSAGNPIISTSDVRTRESEFYLTIYAWIMIVMLIAWVIAFRTWRGEPPSRRTYHWAMPVERSTHVLIRVTAGWALLMATVIVLISIFFVGCGLAQSIADVLHGNTWGQELHGWGETTAPELWQFFLGGFAFPLCSATILYFLISAAVVAVESPGYWIGGIVVAYVVLPWAFVKLSLPGLGRAIRQIWTGDFGLHAALYGTGADLDFARWGLPALLWIGISLAIMTLSAVGSAHLQQRSA